MSRRSLLLGLCVVACSAADDGSDDDFEPTAGMRQGIQKGFPGAQNGDADYCGNPLALCTSGEGDCDANSDCEAGLVCGRDNGPKFGFVFGSDVCVPPHCGNKTKDGDETSIDCGGSCGTICPIVCTSPPLPASGLLGHCSSDCPCSARDADCNIDADCQSGLVCVQNVGASFGFTAGADVCLGATCYNKVQDGDETGVDCGPSCLACASGTVAYGGSGVDRGSAIAFHSASGAYYVLGRFNVTASFGGQSVTSNGSADLFVAKYSAAGTNLWTRSFGGPNNDGDSGLAMAVDSNGAVIVTSSYGGTASSGTTTLTSQGGSVDIALLKFDTNGRLVLARSFGTAGIDRPSAVAADSSGNIWLVGLFDTAVNFGGGTLTASPAAMYDAFVAKFSPSGAHLGSMQIGGTDRDEAWGIAVDPAGAAYVGGGFSGTVTFGSTTQTSLGGRDAYLLKLSSALVPQYVTVFGGTKIDVVLGVAVDPIGQPVVVGSSQSNMTLPTGSVTNQGVFDAFVVALSDTGTVRWHKSFGGAGVDQAVGVVASDTAVGVGGFFEQSVDFGAGALASVGGRDLFRVIYDNNGNLFSAEAFGSAINDTFGGMAVNGLTLATTGSFNGSIDLGSGPVTSTSEDVFIDLKSY